MQQAKGNAESSIWSLLGWSPPWKTGSETYIIRIWLGSQVAQGLSHITVKVTADAFRNQDKQVLIFTCLKECYLQEFYTTLYVENFLNISTSLSLSAPTRQMWRSPSKGIHHWEMRGNVRVCDMLGKGCFWVFSFTQWRVFISLSEAGRRDGNTIVNVTPAVCQEVDIKC